LIIISNLCIDIFYSSIYTNKKSNIYHKPLSKKSRYYDLFTESCRGWNCSNKCNIEWAYEGRKKVGLSRQVMPDGNSVRYQGSMYVSTWKWGGALHQSGWYRRSNKAFVPV